MPWLTSVVPVTIEIPDIRHRTRLGPGVLERLARADAYQSMGLDRRQALWSVKGLPDDTPLPLFAAVGDRDGGAFREEPTVFLPEMGLGEQVADDYRALRLSLKAHPMALLRPQLAEAQGIIPCAELLNRKTDRLGSSRWAGLNLPTSRQCQGGDLCHHRR